MHHRSAEDEAQRVRVVRKNHLNHFRSRLCGTFWRHLHFRSTGFFGFPTRPLAPPAPPACPLCLSGILLAQFGFMRNAAALSILIAVGVAGGSSAPALTVPNGGDFQAALNAAKPGDTIVLAPGATYVGNFTLPAKHADGGQPITVQTADEGTLPAAGERITPAAAGHLAKIRSPNGT